MATGGINLRDELREAHQHDGGEPHNNAAVTSQEDTERLQRQQEAECEVREAEEVEREMERQRQVEEEQVRYALELQEKKRIMEIEQEKLRCQVQIVTRDCGPPRKDMRPGGRKGPGTKDRVSSSPVWTDKETVEEIAKFPGIT